MVWFWVGVCVCVNVCMFSCFRYNVWKLDLSQNRNHENLQNIILSISNNVFFNIVSVLSKTLTRCIV